MNQDFINKLNETSANGNLGTFVQNYRDALGTQYDADVNALNNQRNLDYTTIMNAANRRGMLHSTFPVRDKLKYDVGTYEPTLLKTRQTYMSGLDQLYNNVAKYYNQVRDVQQKIADLNEI